MNDDTKNKQLVTDKQKHMSDLQALSEEVKAFADDAEETTAEIVKEVNSQE